MKIRKKTFRTAWTLAAVLILAFLISACGTGSNGDGDSSGGQSRFLSAAPGEGSYALNDQDQEAAAGDAAKDDVRGGDVQREIEEADIIKIDGTKLYILNQYRGLFVCDISNPDKPSILGRLSISGEPLDMYLRDGRAYVIVSLPQYLYYGLLEAVGAVDSEIPETGSRVVIADVSNPSNLSVAGTVELDGRVADSRIVGNILYVVSSEDYYYGWDDAAAEDGSDIAASVARSITDEDEAGVTDGAAGTTGEEPMLISGAAGGTFVAAIDISDPGNAAEVDRETLEGASAYIHVTDSAIFVPSTPGYYYNDQTTITCVDISDPSGAINKRGNISIPGGIQDKFKMDYADGYFRVCSWEWNESGGKSTLRVIDVSDPDNLAVAGSVELGQGEQLFATRFDGDRAYMVTFEQVDPLWVIDLSDPRNPQVRGELTVPGWSTHIEPRGDRLIALGVDDTNGWQVSISLFNVADPAAPSLVDRVTFGDATGWSSSAAYDDVKALTIIDEMGLILLPYSISSWDGNDYAYEDRLQLIDYSADDLSARGRVAQEGSVLRSRSFEDRLFSISGRQLQVIDASDRDNPAVTATLGLMENIVDFEPLNDQYGIRVVQDDAGLTTLQAVPLQDPEYGIVAGEIALEAGESFAALFASGERVFVVSNYWDYSVVRDCCYYEGVTRVTVYDFGQVASPVRRGRVELDGDYFSASHPDIYGMLYPYSYAEGEFHRLGENALVFVKPPQNDDYPILYDADAEGGDDGLLGAAVEEPEVLLDSEAGVDEGEAGTTGEEPMLISGLENAGETTVTVVDLSDADAPAVASQTVLPYAQASGSFVNKSILYFSYFEESEETDAQGRLQTQYFLGRLDLSDIGAPVELAGINIPGLCLGLNAAGDNGYTLNMEWTGSGETRQFTFNTIRLEGGIAYLQDAVDLGTTDYGWYYGYDYVLADKRAYFSGFGGSSYDSTVLKVVDLGDSNDLKAYDHAFGAGVWTYLMEATGTSVFLRVSDSVACYDTASPDVLSLDDYRSPGGWGNRIVFSGGKAYVPMGYYGLWVKSMD